MVLQPQTVAQATLFEGPRVQLRHLTVTCQVGPAQTGKGVSATPRGAQADSGLVVNSAPCKEGLTLARPVSSGSACARSPAERSVAVCCTEVQNLPAGPWLPIAVPYVNSLPTNRELGAVTAPKVARHPWMELKQATTSTFHWKAIWLQDLGSCSGKPSCSVAHTQISTLPSCVWSKEEGRGRESSSWARAFGRGLGYTRSPSLSVTRCELAGRGRTAPKRTWGVGEEGPAAGTVCTAGAPLGQHGLGVRIPVKRMKLPQSDSVLTWQFHWCSWRPRPGGVPLDQEGPLGSGGV